MCLGPCLRVYWIVSLDFLGFLTNGEMSGFPYVALVSVYQR